MGVLRVRLLFFSPHQSGKEKCRCGTWMMRTQETTKLRLEFLNNFKLTGWNNSLLVIKRQL